MTWLWGGGVACVRSVLFCFLSAKEVLCTINTREHKFIDTFMPTAISAAVWDRQDEQYLIKTLAAGWRSPFLLEQIVQRSRHWFPQSLGIKAVCQVNKRVEKWRNAKNQLLIHPSF